MNDSSLLFFIDIKSSKLWITNSQIDNITANFTSFISAESSNIILSSFNLTNCNFYGSFLIQTNSNLTSTQMLISNSVFKNTSVFMNLFDGLPIPVSVNFMGVQFINSLQTSQTNGALFFYSNPSNFTYIQFSFIKCIFSQISSSFYS